MSQESSGFYQKRSNMHPILITIFGFPIYSYGGMLTVSFLCSTALALHLGKQRKYSGDAVVELVLGCILTGVIGCRLGHVLAHPSHYLQHPLLALNLREGGMTITGGLVLSVLWLLYSYRSRDREGGGKTASVLNVFDFMACPVIIGMAVGRIGCLLHGCCFGEICHLPWGITYPDTTIFPSGLAHGPRHPSPVYEMLMDLLLLAYAYYRFPRIKYAGELFYSFFAGYGVIRFLDEMTRWVEPGTEMGPLNLYQWIAIGFFLFGAAGLAGLFGRPPVDTSFMELEDVGPVDNSPVHNELNNHGEDQDESKP